MPLVTAADYDPFEALLENIHASVHAVAEGQPALIERCDREASPRIGTA
jgi:hypothetical protein